MCGSTARIKYGCTRSPYRFQRYRCKACGHQYTLDRVNASIIHDMIAASRSAADLPIIRAAILAAIKENKPLSV